MTFGSPEWFLLIPAFLFIGWFWKSLRLWSPLRLLLVLLHGFPEFLCEHQFRLCEVIPTPAIQMRNLILSAFPRSMRLPDPFTPNLKVRSRCCIPLRVPFARAAASVNLG